MANKLLEIIETALRNSTEVGAIGNAFATTDAKRAKDLADISRELSVAYIAVRILQETPQFVHDCPECTFLGREVNTADAVDYYICSTHSLAQVVIARYSSNRWNYLSTIVRLASDHPVLSEPLRRARVMGLVKD
jgi:hypothetical protein